MLGHNYEPEYVPLEVDSQFEGYPDLKPPSIPNDDAIPPSYTTSVIGIWNLTIKLGWVWSRVRTYVSQCASCSSTTLGAPWHHRSPYAHILADLIGLENCVPMCHRYDSVKFVERSEAEIQSDPAFWIPWMKGQLTYHLIYTVLNHPFLYITASQYDDRLTTPNTFWKKSSESVLLHATWVVRLLDRASEKRMQLADPFFAHAAAVAGTVHLYFCCATDIKLKQKSKADLFKCCGFWEECGFLSQPAERLVSLISRQFPTT